MIVVEFSDAEYVFIADCIHCKLTLQNNEDCQKSLTRHLRNSIHCSLALQTQRESSEIIKRVELKTLEVAKSTLVTANIDFFDATLLYDIQKFSLFCEIANFVQQFRQCQHQYRKSNLLTLLFDCLRESALI